MFVRDLDSSWTVAPISLRTYHRPQCSNLAPIPAQVPGHVHVDLVNAGVIGDPFHEMQEAGATWIDYTDWLYACEFNWAPRPACPNQVLKFEGLDTIATISLNGEVIGHGDNMFLPVEVDVTGKLVNGSNKLEIRFDSAIRIGDERRSVYFAKEGLPADTVWFDERAFVRKPGYMYGWDWGPRLVSCGIWRPVSLLEFASRITSCSVLTTPVGDGTYQVNVEASVEGKGELSVAFNGVSQGALTEFTVQGDAWEPNGEGSPVLHDVTVQYGAHKVSKKVGLRTVELVRQPDEYGTSFEFKVNGKRVWSRGANWIPNDSFPSRITGEELDQAIARYAKLGMNMLRVWGGGLYETDEFYDACDKYGIMVWQDFPYACSLYPDGPAEQDLAKTEALYHIRRLKDRACHVLWCGNNENRSLYFGKWPGPGPLAPRFYGENLYDKALKEAVLEGDPGKGYIESSPVLVKGMKDTAEVPALHSDDHYWDVWHGRGDWKYYRESPTRFCSEFGFASACSREAWTIVSDRTLTPEDRSVRWHDKTNKPWDIYRGMVEMHYPASRSIDDWIYHSQLNQRDAMRAAVEHYRSNPACRGALIWQINDCWPVQSWAMEDYKRLIKPAGFELIRIYASALVAAMPEGAVVSNDSQLKLKDTLVYELWDAVNNRKVRSAEFAVNLEPAERETITTLKAEGLDPLTTLGLVYLKGQPVSDRWITFAEPKDLKLPQSPVSIDIKDDVLTLSVDGFAMDLTISTDGAEICLVDMETELAGTRAYTGSNLSLKFKVLRTPSVITVRSLAGVHWVGAIPTQGRMATAPQLV